MPLHVSAGQAGMMVGERACGWESGLAKDERLGGMADGGQTDGRVGSKRSRWTAVWVCGLTTGRLAGDFIS